MDRRDFLTASLMTVAVFKGTKAEAASAVPAVPAAAPAAPYVFSENRFRAFVGTRFHLTAPDWRGHVQLTEVVEGPRAAELEQFTTVFTCDEPTAPAAGLYEVSHPDAGRFSLRIDGRSESGVRIANFALLRAS